MHSVLMLWLLRENQVTDAFDWMITASELMHQYAIESNSPSSSLVISAVFSLLEYQDITVNDSILPVPDICCFMIIIVVHAKQNWQQGWALWKSWGIVGSVDQLLHRSITFLSYTTNDIHLMRKGFTPRDLSMYMRYSSGILLLHLSCVMSVAFKCRW